MISPGVAVDGAWFPPVPEFLRPLPPRFRPPPHHRLSSSSASPAAAVPSTKELLPEKSPPSPAAPDFPTSYQVYNPYYNPYLYPYLSRPLPELYSPPQSPLRPPPPPPPPTSASKPSAPPPVSLHSTSTSSIVSTASVKSQPPPAHGGSSGRCRTRLRPSRAAGFARGSLIRLSSGELRRIEEMRTEDFISSAESCPQLRLDPSTVVRIETTLSSEVAVLTLRYGESRSQIEVESSADHPYFVYGQGWASCRPEKTLATYGLKCHLLQVGDVCISLSPRPSSSTISGDRKRRWSAPDQIQQDLQDQPTDYHKPRSQPPPASPP